MSIPAEYQQAHTTLGCAKSTYPLGPTYCTSHHENWTPDGCPVAVRVAREVGGDALERAAEEAAFLEADHDVAEQAASVPGEVGRQAVIDRWMAVVEEPYSWLRLRAERLRKGEGE